MGASPTTQNKEYNDRKPSTSEKSQNEKTKSLSLETSVSMTKIEPIQRWWVSTAFILAFLFVFSTLIYVISDEFTPNNNSNEKCIENFQASKEHSAILLIAVWQRFAVYTYFIIRTYLLFKSTQYAISYKRLYVYLGTLFIVYTMQGIIFLYASFTCNTNLFLLITMISLLTEMFLAIFCLHLIIHRLFKSYRSWQDILAADKDKKAQKRLNKLIKVATKITVLALCALMSTNINVMVFGGAGLAMSGTVMDTAVNSICLLLTFAAFERTYKSLCKPCDQCVLSCCENTKCVRCCCCICD